MPSKKLKDTKPYNILFPHKTITDWDHLVKFYNQKREEWSGWIFRGHRDSEWSLTTTIERLAIEQWSRTYDELPTIEAGLIRSFRRHFHHYSQFIPNEDDNIQWLSIMQHYGTITRLLDCTYSFYAALFFALGETTPIQKPDNMSAIWAFDAEWLYNGLKDKLNNEEKNEYGYIDFKDVVTDPKRDNYFLFQRDQAIPSVCTVNPFKLNERLIIQQGVFLSPGDIKKSFIDNLVAVTENRSPKKHLYLILLPNSSDFLKVTIRELNRMNMNSATLFPGLDGFARHLNSGLIVPKLIKVGKK